MNTATALGLDVITGELVPNPVVKVTPLRAYPGWVVREYRNGMYDGTNDKGLTCGCRSFQEVVAEINTPAMGFGGRKAVA